MKKLSIFLALILSFSAIAQPVMGLVQCSACDEWIARNKEARMKLIIALNDLGLKIQQDLLAKDPTASCCVSPLSLGIVLGMVAEGLGEEDQVALLAALNLQMDIVQFRQALAHLIQASNMSDKALVELANGLLINTPNVYENYVSTLQNSFDGKVLANDGDPIAAINGWVSHKTHGRIENLLDERQKDMALCVISALYFKGQWKNPFNAERTFEDSFGPDAKAQFMVQTLGLSYMEAERFELVVLPYLADDGRELSFVVVLPKEGSSVQDIAAILTASRLQACLTQAKSKQVRITLPKLEIKADNSALLDQLCALGLPLHARLSQISADPLEISVIKQAVSLTVDEKGAEGAAATAAVMVRSMAASIVEFNCNKPFMYFVIEDGVMLFAGTVQGADALV